MLCTSTDSRGACIDRSTDLRRLRATCTNRGAGRSEFRYNAIQAWRDGREAEGGGLLNRYRG